VIEKAVEGVYAARGGTDADDGELGHAHASCRKRGG
jgi:hypothetical protein